MVSALVLVLFPGCTTVPGHGDDAVAHAPSAGASSAGTSGEPVVRAFGDTLRTYYEQRWHEQREEASWRPDRALLERRARAGAQLIRALERAGFGVSPARAARGLAGLAPLVERYVHTRTPFAFAALGGAQRGGANAFAGSFLVAAGIERRAGQRAEIAGRPVRWSEVHYERTLVPPYVVWAAERAGSPAAAPPVHVVDTVFYLDHEAIGRQIETRLLARAAHYRETERRFPTADAIAAAPADRRASIVRDLLRWRAVRPRLDGKDAAQVRAQLVRWRAAQLAFATAAWLRFAEETDPVQRQARAALAGLRGPDPLDALATIVGMYAETAPAAGLLALQQLGAALFPGERLERWLPRLAFVSVERLRQAATRN